MPYFHTINIQVDSLTKISNDIIGFVFQSFLSIYLKLNSKNFCINSAILPNTLTFIQLLVTVYPKKVNPNFITIKFFSLTFSL